MKDIIEELYDEIINRKSKKSREMEAVGDIKGIMIKLSIRCTNDNWIVYAMSKNSVLDIINKNFHESYEDAKIYFYDLVKKYDLGYSKII